MSERCYVLEAIANDRVSCVIFEWQKIILPQRNLSPAAKTNSDVRDSVRRVSREFTGRA